MCVCYAGYAILSTLALDLVETMQALVASTAPMTTILSPDDAASSLKRYFIQFLMFPFSSFYILSHSAAGEQSCVIK